MEIKEILCEIEPELLKVDDYLSTCFIDVNNQVNNGFLYILKSGGKRLRPALTILSASYGSENIDRFIPIASAVELVHLASLVHDDLIDSSSLRRGKATVHRLCGKGYSLHLGDLMFSRAIGILEQYKIKSLNALLASTVMEMCRGEIEQLAIRHDFQQDLKKYLRLVKRKTSGLMELCCRAGAIASGANPQITATLGRYGHYIGMAYQIMDDVLDFTAGEVATEDLTGTDIQQGIITLPLIFFFKEATLSERACVGKILLKKEITAEDVFLVTRMVNETRAVGSALEVAGAFIRKALRQLNLLPVNSATKTLEEIARFILRYGSN